MTQAPARGTPTARYGPRSSFPPRMACASITLDHKRPTIRREIDRSVVSRRELRAAWYASPLIDADLRNPSLHRVLNLENSVGLSSNYLSGARPEADDLPCATQSREWSNRHQFQTLPRWSAVRRLLTLPSLAGPRLGLLLTEAAESSSRLSSSMRRRSCGLADAPILERRRADGNHAGGFEGAKTRRNVVRGALKRLHFSARSHRRGRLTSNESRPEARPSWLWLWLWRWLAQGC